MEEYSFILRFIRLKNKNEYEREENHTIKVQAPHYEAAVAYTLAYGQQFLRDNDEEDPLYFRLCLDE